MKTSILIGSVCLLALAACGLEGVFSNATHGAYERPASIIRGSLPMALSADQIVAIDGAGNEVKAFERKAGSGRYELRLPSSQYSFLRVQARAGNFWLRAIVPYVGEESSVDGADLDARGMTEAMIVEARISTHIPGEPAKFQQLTPAAYLGDGVTNGTRTLIRAAMDRGPTSWDPTGATSALMHMVERFMARMNPGSADADSFFRPAVFTPAFAVSVSPIASQYVNLNPFDYDGDGVADGSDVKFTTKLGQVVQLYQPGGCPDPDNVRVIFEVDFNEGSMDGNCNAADRFKWVTDKPGKRMYFTGGIHKDSPITAAARPDLQRLLGSWVPNQVPMYDDGTNGDEVAGDNIWTISFALPPGVRVSYKYEWGIRGDNWTGSEEWPGNQRLLEITDVNGDKYVRRRDVFADEATNKDRSNLNNASGTGAIDWTTDLHGCGPEAHEKPFTVHTMCQCSVAWVTPQALGPLTMACAAP